MIFAECKPRWGKLFDASDPMRLGPGNGKFHMVFTCPLHGTHEISVHFHAGEPNDALKIWKAIPMPESPDWPKIATLLPSINNHCGFHKTIINGEFA